MDADYVSNQQMNISGLERENQEAGNVKGGSHKGCPNGCMGFVRPTLFPKITAETISTFILVFVTWGYSILDHGRRPLMSELGVSVAFGLILTFMIYSVNHIFGAHMNPAVTIAFATVRHFPWKQVPAYIAAQLCGSIAACFALSVMLKPVSNTALTIPAGIILQALALEVVVSFVFLFVMSTAAKDSSGIMQPGELAVITVGSMVMISSIFAGSISGGSMNSERSLGPAIANNNYISIWVYILGPIAGTLMGACSYTLIRPTEKSLQAISLR